jgi:dimethylhistidine N-methyltransferase
VPRAIELGAHDHREPFPGDQGIRFEPRRRGERPPYTRIDLGADSEDLGPELRRALTAPQKVLPCKYLYDAAGLELFERICEVPEYYLTRTETAILQQQAPAILDLCPPKLTLVEMGSGSARKTRFLIEPCLARQRDLTYYAIDIAAAALDNAGPGLARDYPLLRFVGLAGDFDEGLDYLARQRGRPRLVVFLGSTVGNFTPKELAGFLRGLRRALRPEDRFLLGFDLLKDAGVLVRAYDDAAGVTARFNLNLLARLNREYGANFRLDAFAHRALFNRRESRVEMHLVSQCKQVVRVAGLDLELPFHEGETIHTENCYKHRREAMRAHLERHGFSVQGTFTDAQQWFCLFLAS